MADKLRGILLIMTYAYINASAFKGGRNTTQVSLTVVIWE